MKYRIIKVVTETQYLVPIANEQTGETEVNGWTVQQVIKDWFRKMPLGVYHATREAFKIGANVKILNISVTKKIRQL